MDEKDKSGQEPSENEPFKDSELMSLINDLKNSIDSDDEIIELTEDMIVSLEDEVIELTDIVEAAGTVNPVGNEQEIVMKDLEEDIVDSDEYIKDDFAASLGMEIESEIDLAEEFAENKTFDLEEESPIGSGTINVSPQQVEAAIERVVQKILGDKIDSILIEVIERAVKQEIIRLKNVLRVDENDFD
ncbi:MAG: hypothetical protein KKC46_16465 [Proteobacteria bacterium]|nr:hypothetical protein [Pseudomonadota bacterium]